METSLKLQMDVRNNAEELRRFMLDLENWEDEMKRKEMELKKDVGKQPLQDLPPPRNKIKHNVLEKQQAKTRSQEEKPKKISAYDYSGWEKFDADKACDELDEKSEKDEEEEEEERKEEVQVEEEKNKPIEKEKKENVANTLKMADEAFYEKELGNQFVKKEKWEDAIKCYTRAIDLDPKNAVYYANRSLCFLKLKKSSEVDATVAIQLDDTYVKAYVRRAVARTALGQLKEALSDYRKIIHLEPKNAFANAEIAKLEKIVKASEAKPKEQAKPTFDPKAMFKSEGKKSADGEVKKSDKAVKAEEGKKDQVARLENVEKSVPKSTEKISDDNSKNSVPNKDMQKNNSSDDGKGVFGKIPEGFVVVKHSYIPPHLRSKKPLQSIPVQNITSDKEIFRKLSNLSKTPDQSALTAKITPEVNVKPTEDKVDLNQLDLEPPKTCYEFRSNWKLVKNSPQHAWNYIRKFSITQLLKYDLDSNLLSEIISCLSNDEILRSVRLNDIIDILMELPFVERFGSLRLFMTSSDIQNIEKIINCYETAMNPSRLQNLRTVYQLN